MASKSTGGEKDKRSVLCPRCNAPLEVSKLAQSTMCPHCHRSIDVQDHKIDYYCSQRSVETAGEIRVEKKGTLRAETDIKAHHLVVKGEIIGKRVEARESIELSGTGRIRADVRAATLHMEDGAILVGRCEIPAPPSAPTEIEPRGDKVDPATLVKVADPKPTAAPG